MVSDSWFRSIPLTDVVECTSKPTFNMVAHFLTYLSFIPIAFKIFHSTQGKQGYLGEASKQQLENLFGTSKDIDAAQELLQKGIAQASDGFADDGATKNLLRGDFNKGSGARLSGV